MDDIKAKQQIVEKIKASTNILVTVSNDPSVDALSAAIGLTLLLDKLDKHPTAVFSGTVPPALAFLEPEKILDDTTDSLRDFIIALDKEKADHLRYKVEGDSVKIFITPYKTTITSDDLEFSQGDFNVELVIALGVDNQDHLDGALESHGQILHDATVITVTSGEQTSTLGGIDWHDDQASSLSEMLAGLSEALKEDKKKSLLDAQTATAFLTGIVAQTDRFSNQHTTSKAMTVASQLMAAGADQQLIATKLEEEAAPAPETPTDAAEDKGSLKIEKDEPVEEKTEEKPADKTNLAIHHEPFETLEEMDKRVKAAEQAEAAKAASEALDHTANAVATGPYAATTDTPDAPEAPEEAEAPAADSLPTIGEVKTSTITPLGSSASELDPAEEPTFGGTLNATTEEAAETARQDLASDQNKTTLSHSYLGGASSTATPMNGNETSANAFVIGESNVGQTLPQPEPLSPVVPTPPVTPGPVDLGLPMPPPLPDFPAPVQATGPYAPEPAAQPERLGDILAPEAPAVPPVAPPALTTAADAPIQPTGPYAAPPAPNDPGQFKIPGQS